MAEIDADVCPLARCQDGPHLLRAKARAAGIVQANLTPANWSLAHGAKPKPNIAKRDICITPMLKLRRRRPITSCISRPDGGPSI